MLNAYREDVCRFLSPTAFEDSSSVASSLPQPFPDTNGIPQILNKVLAGPAVPSDIGDESIPSGLPDSSPPERLFTQPEQTPARPPLVNSPSQCLGNLSSSVSELLSSGQGALSTVYQPDIFQEFRTRLEDKSIDISTLAFYKQNFYEYEQGTAPALVKGRLRAHLPFWVEIGAPPWVLELSCQVMLFPSSLPLPVFACLRTSLL